MPVNNKIPAEDVVRKHKSTKIRRTREPDSNVTVYLCLPCATLLIVYEDIGFLYVCSVFASYRVPAYSENEMCIGRFCAEIAFSVWSAIAASQPLLSLTCVL